MKHFWALSTTPHCYFVQKLTEETPVCRQTCFPLFGFVFPPVGDKNWVHSLRKECYPSGVDRRSSTNCLSVFLHHERKKHTQQRSFRKNERETKTVSGWKAGKSSGRKWEDKGSGFQAAAVGALESWESSSRQKHGMHVMLGRRGQWGPLLSRQVEHTPAKAASPETHRGEMGAVVYKVNRGKSKELRL